MKSPCTAVFVMMALLPLLLTASPDTAQAGEWSVSYVANGEVDYQPRVTSIIRGRPVTNGPFPWRSNDPSSWRAANSNGLKSGNSLKSSGTLTATLTWTPNPDIPNDKPPTEIYVQEVASVTANARITQTLDPNATASGSASVNNGLFSIVRVEPTTPNSWGKSSSGKRYRKVAVPPAGVVTLPSVSLSAEVMIANVQNGFVGPAVTVNYSASVASAPYVGISEEAFNPGELGNQAPTSFTVMISYWDIGVSSYTLTFRSNLVPLGQLPPSPETFVGAVVAGGNGDNLYAIFPYTPPPVRDEATRLFYFENTGYVAGMLIPLKATTGVRVNR